MQRPSSLPSFTPAQVKALFRAVCYRLKKPGIDFLLAPALLPYGRILVITSRKVGSAPTRNKIRRRLKALFYEQQLFTHGHECIVIIRPDGAHTSFEDLKMMLLAAFEKHQHPGLTKKDSSKEAA